MGNLVSLSVNKERIVQKITVSLFVTWIILIAGLQLLLPPLSYAEQDQNQAPYYTIQLGTYISEDAAERNYQRLLGRLNDRQLQYLRIEKIKKYYVVRIGRYKNKDAADRFYPIVRAKVADSPLVTKTRVGPQSLIKQYELKTIQTQKKEKSPPPAKTVPPKIAKAAAGKEKALSPPPETRKEEQIVSSPPVQKEKQSAPTLVGRKKRPVASLVMPTPPEAQEKCIAKPVLVLADVSGSMLENAMGNGSQPEGKPGAGELLKKIEVEKQLLLRISRQLVSSQCGFGVYRFRFFSGKQLLYEPLLKIDSYGKRHVRNTLENYFTTDYEAYNRRSPITDVLQQLDTDILWKMSGRLTILLISDGIVTNNGFQYTSNSQIQKNKHAVNGLLDEVRRLKKKYGAWLTIHTVYIASRDDKSPNDGGAYQLLKNIAKLGNGSVYAGISLPQNDRLMSELSAELCCAGK